ncbi:MAG TPA: YraN family protein [Candidatus Sulfotelmatobacter sp.]|nr:YraN family protein [Candidatus Sulfotelmatobacter sp.]
MATHLSKGERGEDLAAAYLGLIGWALEGRRVRLAGVEVDLVARDGRTRVLVEVKLRTHSGFGGAPFALEHDQAERLRRAAAALLRRSPEPVRVDLIAVDLTEGEARIRHYPNAAPGR